MTLEEAQALPERGLFDEIETTDREGNKITIPVLSKHIGAAFSPAYFTDTDSRLMRIGEDGDGFYKIRA